MFHNEIPILSYIIDFKANRKKNRCIDNKFICDNSLNKSKFVLGVGTGSSSKAVKHVGHLVIMYIGTYTYIFYIFFED